MHTDPIADMVTRIRNASRARLPRIEVPWSDLKWRLASVLKREGFIDDFREIAAETKGQGSIEIKLRYDGRGEPVISGVNRVSTPGLRRYFGASDIPRIRSGLGVVILTTSKGILTDREARAARVGGEALCTIW